MSCKKHVQNTAGFSDINMKVYNKLIQIYNKCSEIIQDQLLMNEHTDKIIDNFHKKETNK